MIKADKYHLAIPGAIMFSNKIPESVKKISDTARLLKTKRAVLLNRPLGKKIKYFIYSTTTIPLAITRISF